MPVIERVGVGGWGLGVERGRWGLVVFFWGGGLGGEGEGVPLAHLDDGECDADDEDDRPEQSGQQAGHVLPGQHPFVL